jgi:hypothetical protein
MTNESATASAIMLIASVAVSDARHARCALRGSPSSTMLILGSKCTGDHRRAGGLARALTRKNEAAVPGLE